MVLSLCPVHTAQRKWQYWSYNYDDSIGRYEVSSILDINNYEDDRGDDDDSDRDDYNDDGDGDDSTNPSARSNRVVWKTLTIIINMVFPVKKS